MAKQTSTPAFKAAPVPKDLEKLGFAPADDDVPNRILIASQGLDKCGKSNFWMTAPGPIAGINLDIGLEGVIHKHSKKKSVWVMTLNIPVSPTTKRPTYEDYWKRSEQAYMTALHHKDVRTVVVDDGTNWWELMRLAEFGTTSPREASGQLAYGPINQLWRSLIREAYNTDKNLIITHKVKEVWTSTKGAGGKQERSWDGETYQRAGFNEQGYLIQANIEHFRRDGEFGIRVLNCRQNMSLAGYEFGEDECDFPTLASTVFGNDKKDWV